MTNLVWPCDIQRTDGQIEPVVIKMLMPYSAIKKQILLFASEEPGVLVEGDIGFYAQNIGCGNIHLCHLHRQIAEKQHSECIKLSERRDEYIDAQVSKCGKLPLPRHHFWASYVYL